MLSFRLQVPVWTHSDSNNVNFALQVIRPWRSVPSLGNKCRRDSPRDKYSTSVPRLRGNSNHSIGVMSATRERWLALTCGITGRSSVLSTGLRTCVYCCSGRVNCCRVFPLAQASSVLPFHLHARSVDLGCLLALW